MDSDFVITGGRDNTLRIWKVSDCQPINSSGSAIKKFISNIVCNLVFIALETVTKTKKKLGKSPENITEEQQRHDAPKPKKILDSVSKLDHGAVTDQIDDCRRLFLSQQEYVEETSTNGKLYKIDVLDVFKARDDVLRLLESEGMLSVANTNIEILIH